MFHYPIMGKFVRFQTEMKKLSQATGRSGASGSMHKQAAISLFDYTDYRKYLADYYVYRKERNPKFSYRSFAMKASFSSSGLYKDIVGGKRGLSRALIAKFGQALDFTRREADYFENMVYFNDARSVEEQKLYFSKMMAVKESNARILHGGQFEYFSQWYYAVIRELLNFRDCPQDPARLAMHCSPSIQPEQAAKALKLLEGLGLIGKSPEGRYSRTDPILSTRPTPNDPKINLLNLMNYQKLALQLAEQAFDRYELDQLDMSTLTLSVSGRTYQIIKEELAAFRKKLLNLAVNDEHPDRVYQLNQHFFPMSKHPPGKRIPKEASDED
jgi:uncharacterized protein (TIGR02147 family)